MPISFTINYELNIINEVYVGTITLDELKDHWIRLTSDPQASEIRRSLSDLRGASFAFTGNDLLSAVQNTLAPLLKERSWKSAQLTNQPYEYGVSRQFQMLTECFMQDSVFTDYDSAMQWLLGYHA